MSHGANDVDLALASVEQNLGVFTMTDVHRFANTLLHAVGSLPLAMLRSKVDGTGPVSADSLGVVYWTGLAQYDARVLTRLVAIEDQIPRHDDIHDRDYQGYAALLRMHSPSLTVH